MRRFSVWQRMMVAFSMLTCGTLLQTSCSETAADVTTGVISSVTTQLIRNVVYDFFEVSSVSLGQ
ncbi:MAG: hypothetical protein HRF43_16785 [Phycisphaerae bacterium]